MAACVIAEHLAGRWASAITALLLILVVQSVDAAKLVRPMNPYIGLSLIIGAWFHCSEKPGEWPRWMLPPSTARSITAWIVIGIATLVLVDAVRRRDRIVIAGFAIAAGAVVSLLIGYSMMPASGPGVLTTFYTVRWIAPAGMLVWLVVLIGGVRSVRARSDRFVALRDGVRAGGFGAVSYGIVAVAALIGVVGAVPAGHEVWGYEPARTIGDAAVREVERGERYLVDGDRSRPSLSLTPAVVYRLRRAGVAVTMSPDLYVWVDPLGDSYAPAGRPCDGRLTIRMVDETENDPDQVLVVDTERDGDGPFVELLHDPTDLPDAC